MATKQLYAPKVFKQSTASARWEINHGLGRNPAPSVKVMYQGVLTEILPADIQYPTENQMVIIFSQLFSGEVTYI